MNTEYLIVDYGSKSKVVKNVCAVSPNVDRSIFSEALVVEAINLSDLPTFVITSDQCDSFRISDLEGQKKEK